MPVHPTEERHYLTREEYAAANGADPEDVRKILEFATARGLKAGDVNEAERTVQLGYRCRDQRGFRRRSVYLRAGRAAIESALSWSHRAYLYSC